MLEKIVKWLQSFPGWEDSIRIDCVDARPGSAGLYPKGFREISRREDVLGNLQVSFRFDVLLRKNAESSEENAKWLLEFQNWVAEQDRLGLAPKFGDDPKRERIRASEGQLLSLSQVGSALYTVKLWAEFTKIYKGE